MADQQKRASAKNLTTSVHRKERYSHYKNNIYARNKLTRIIRSCGSSFAQKWARAHQAEGVCARLLKGYDHERRSI